ncbi:hypothetical protein HMPREF1983_00655 [Gemella bergeri ATCC 700627]|uniref:Uncharacterized protein n=1 Tax=Gemella bergeri ATCC 700627 TaxID=1321820 RepID=U2QRL9_9BACL|nr:hypothetical protein HMPREF1983_00655 [Gemella bergeri ATCC 700627]
MKLKETLWDKNHAYIDNKCDFLLYGFYFYFDFKEKMEYYIRVNY